MHYCITWVSEAIPANRGERLETVQGANETSFALKVKGAPETAIHPHSNRASLERSFDSLGGPSRPGDPSNSSSSALEAA